MSLASSRLVSARCNSLNSTPCLGQSNRGLEHACERELAIALAAVVERRRSRRDRRRFVPDQAFALGQETRRRSVGGARRTVERDRSQPVEVEQDHRLPAEARRGRFADTERERRSDCSIDGVAAVLEHLDASVRREVMLGRDHAVGGRRDPLRVQATLGPEIDLARFVGALAHLLNGRQELANSNVRCNKLVRLTAS